MTYPHVRVWGNGFDRGRGYGEQAGDRIRASIAGYAGAFEHYAGWDWGRTRREAKRFEPSIDDFHPGSLEEIRGIAEGAGVDADDILALNVRTEVMFAAKARQATGHARVPPECTAVAVLPEASASGHTLLAQNWDWLLHCFDTVVVLEVEQRDGPAFATVVEAGLLAKCGMNSSGVGIATNALVTDRDAGEPGVPYHVMLRAMFDCETLSDIVGTVQRGSRSSSANYLVAHRDGIALDIESAPGGLADFYLCYPERDVVVHTNHFTAPDARRHDLSLWAMPDSAIRYDRIRTAIDRDHRSITPHTLGERLADHADYPSAICCHPDPRDPAPERGATVASVVMDLDAQTMWLADGQPCTTPFRQIDDAGLLAKPSMLRPRSDVGSVHAIGGGS